MIHKRRRRKRGRKRRREKILEKVRENSSRKNLRKEKEEKEERRERRNIRAETCYRNRRHTQTFADFLLQKRKEQEHQNFSLSLIVSKSKMLSPELFLSLKNKPIFFSSNFLLFFLSRFSYKKFNRRTHFIPFNSFSLPLSLSLLLSCFPALSFFLSLSLFPTS